MQNTVIEEVEAVQLAFAPFAKAKQLELLSPRIVAVNEQDWQVRQPTAWHRERAAKLDVPLAERLRLCGQHTLAFRCGCQDKPRTLIPEGCGLARVCQTCGSRRDSKDRRRIRDSIAGILKDNKRLQCYMLTITASHGDGLAQDARWWTAAIGGFKDAILRQSKRAHVLTRIEATNGIDSPHVHAHLIVLARWLDYKRLWKSWRRIASIRSRHADRLDFQRWQGKRDHAAGRAAWYLAGTGAADYLAGKDGGEEKNPLSGSNVGVWLGAMLGKRTLRVTGRFWRFVPCYCRSCGVIPECLGRVAPHTAIALGEQSGLDHAKHGLQGLPDGS